MSKYQSVKVLCLLYAFLGASLCFAQMNEEADFMAAKKAFTDGFYALAEENIETFLDTYPDTPHLYEAHLLLGRCFYYQNNSKKASYEFSIILNAAPTVAPHDSAFYWLGDILYRGGDFKGALEYYQKVIDGYPTSKYLPYSLYSKAWAYYKLGFLEEASSTFATVVSNYPLDRLAIDSLFEIGQTQYLQGKLEDARDSLNNFINKYPLSEKIAESYYLLGNISLKLEQYSDSILFFKRAASISPGARWADLASYGMAQAYFKLGDLDESIKRFKMSADAASNDLIARNALLGVIYSYDKKGMSDDALKACDHLNIKYPKTAEAAEGCYIKARILYDKNRLAEAEEVCLKGLENFTLPEQGGKLHFELGWIYLKENKVRNALAEFKMAVKGLGNGALISSALCKIGDIYISEGDLEEAAKSFDTSLKTYPASRYSDYAQYRLGDIFLMSQKYDLAILAYQSLVVNFQNTGLKERSLFKMGVAYFKKGYYPEALAELERSARLSPAWGEDNTYKFYLANCLYNVNKYEEAAEILKPLAKNPVDHEIAMRAQYLLGWCNYRTDRDMEAADAFYTYSKRYPDSVFSQDALRQSSSILLNAAQNFEKWKMPDDAARVYRKLAEMNVVESELANKKLVELKSK